jgi:formylglycine-generating enzyme
MMKTARLLSVLPLLGLTTTSSPADTFGSGDNAFIIDFVTIGNPANGADATIPRPNSGAYGDQPGGVAYTYRIATTEVPEVWIAKAANLGLTNVAAGAWGSLQPAANLTWYECAAFVNWLNTSTGHHPAYQLTLGNSGLTLWSSAVAWQAGGENLYRHKNAYYFIPSEDEWYKAAYHKNDGVTANYWQYATGSNNTPDGIGFSGDTAFDAVFRDLFNQGHPNEVTNVGVASPYGTFGQNGNVFEWQETALDGVNDSPSESRGVRGGEWSYSAAAMSAGDLSSNTPDISDLAIGFRVASVAPDGDADGIPDEYETGTGIYVSPQNTGTSPTNSDSDGDGLGDGAEVFTHGSNPNLADTDADGFFDGYEYFTGHSPIDPTDKPALVADVKTAIEFTFPSAFGKTYRIEASADLDGWEAIETEIAGTGGEIQRFYSTRGLPKRYLRVEEDAP